VLVPVEVQSRSFELEGKSESHYFRYSGKAGYIGACAKELRDKEGYGRRMRHETSEGSCVRAVRNSKKLPYSSIKMW